MKVVEKGAAFLDEHEPGWYEKIDPDALDLGSSCNCVLGQLYRSEHPRLRQHWRAYERKVAALGLSFLDAGRLGFDAYGSARYPGLTTAWRRLIKRRQRRIGSRHRRQS